eukprot:Gb_09582 [translate_table: standard]
MSTSVLSLAFEPKVKVGIGLESMERSLDALRYYILSIIESFRGTWANSSTMDKLYIMGRSGHARRIEPAGLEFIEALPEFILSLQDDFATVNHLRFKVTEATKAEATQTSMEGSLNKMVAKARTPTGLAPRSVFHQGLIKTLYTFELQKRSAAPQPSIRPKGRKPFPSKQDSLYAAHKFLKISGEVIWFLRFYDADREVGSIGSFLGKVNN